VGGAVIRQFHRGLGLVIAVLYVIVLLNRSRFLPNLVFAGRSVGAHEAGTGYLLAVALPFAAVICFLWRERLMWWFSPRIPPDYAYLLRESAWYLLGYILLIVGIGILQLFR
jgi:hypothetical protein